MILWCGHRAVTAPMGDGIIGPVEIFASGLGGEMVTERDVRPLSSGPSPGPGRRPVNSFLSL
jgi:hypothetical protein